MTERFGLSVAMLAATDAAGDAMALRLSAAAATRLRGALSRITEPRSIFELGVLYTRPGALSILRFR